VTAPETRRERGKQRRRQAAADQIIDAALQLLATEGYEALTITRIADVLGYAAAALYRYFPSKHALFVGVQIRVLETVRNDLQAALGRIDAHIERARSLDVGEASLLRLFSAALAHRGVAMQRPSFFALLSLSLSDPRELVPTEIGRQVVPALGALNGEFARLLGQASEARALDPGDPVERAVLFWSAHQGILQLRKLERFSVPGLDFGALTYQVTAALLRGWGADDARLRELYLRAERVYAETRGAES
jgi:AcrR family transcriptional regulator